mmetsp:Transcript_9237/g.20529  ORF Transcript_9237/g.20529 Transcript_9237/m.20529 type:complete len:231 (-) Transcript_9237:1007-1699(-)
MLPHQRKQRTTLVSRNPGRRTKRTSRDRRMTPGGAISRETAAVRVPARIRIRPCQSLAMRSAERVTWRCCFSSRRDISEADHPWSGAQAAKRGTRLRPPGRRTPGTRTASRGRTRSRPPLQEQGWSLLPRGRRGVRPACRWTSKLQRRSPPKAARARGRGWSLDCYSALRPLELKMPAAYQVPKREVSSNRTSPNLTMLGLHVGLCASVRTASQLPRWPQTGRRTNGNSA